MYHIFAHTPIWRTTPKMADGGTAGELMIKTSSGTYKLSMLKKFTLDYFSDWLGKKKEIVVVADVSGSMTQGGKNSPVVRGIEEVYLQLAGLDFDYEKADLLWVSGGKILGESSLDAIGYLKTRGLSSDPLNVPSSIEALTYLEVSKKSEYGGGNANDIPFEALAKIGKPIVLITDGQWNKPKTYPKGMLVLTFSEMATGKNFFGESVKDMLPGATVVGNLDVQKAADGRDLDKEEDEEFADHKVELFFQEGTSDKEYHLLMMEVESGKYVVNFKYGRRGSNLKEGTKTPSAVSLEEAEKIYAKYLKEKTREGYEPSEKLGHGNILDRGDRPSPKESATLYSEGTERIGQDGKMWKIIVTSNGHHRWSRVSKMGKGGGVGKGGLVIKNIDSGKFVETEENGKVTYTGKIKDALMFTAGDEDSVADAESTLALLNDTHKAGFSLVEVDNHQAVYMAKNKK